MSRTSVLITLISTLVVVVAIAWAARLASTTEQGTAPDAGVIEDRYPIIGGQEMQPRWNGADEDDQ